MANYPLTKTVYPKGVYENVIDTSFAQPPPPPKENTITVEEFFSYYNTIFYDIPVEGNTNSHAFLTKKSGEYVGVIGFNDDTQILLDEISALQKENLALNQQLINIQISGSTNNI
mgnify:CR=1 FL=1